MNKKKLLLFCFLLFLINIVTAQIDFTELSNRWYVARTYPNGNIQNPYFIATTTTLFGINGDTLINSEIWSKIGSTQDSIFPSTSYINLGAVKVDQNFILFIEQDSSSIDTIYNFNLNVGDSVLYYFFPYFNNYLYVDSIDSILINGFYHKRIFFETLDFPLCCRVEEVWIEGIGSLHGPLFSFYPKMLEIESYDEGNDLTCFEQNDSVIWSHPDYSDCYINIVLTINKPTINNDLFYYPNPTKGLITIDVGNTYKKINIKINNAIGDEVLNENIRSTNTILLNIKRLEKGIYFIHILADNENAVLKIVKE